MEINWKRYLARVLQHPFTSGMNFLRSMVSMRIIFLISKMWI